MASIGWMIAVCQVVYVLDSGFALRWVVKPKVWGPLLLAGLAYYRFATDSTSTLLDTVNEAARIPTESCMPAWLSQIIHDLIGFIVLKEVFLMGLRFTRWVRETLHQKLPSSKDVTRAAMAVFMKVAAKLPVLSSVLQAQLDKELSKMEKSLFEQLRPADRDALPDMPVKGMDSKAIIRKMKALGKKEDVKWQEGLVSGAVYHGEEEHLKLMNEAYAAFSVSNPLHPDIWPSSMKFESEIIKWVADLVRGGDSNVCGAITSGGTESIILAVKAHRDRAREEKGITNPEIIACVNAHAALDKACDLMNIRLVKIPMDKTYRLSARAVKNCISADTIMVYASAPAFPQGAIDPVRELSEVCFTNDIGLHVDCCLGGFILPFAAKMKDEFDIPEFDFGLKGVTSMSADTHKYGYASKGTSVVLYRNKKLRKYQYFAYPEWPGGLYVTPTIAGSRPGALTAAAWAAMASIGMEGYMDTTRKILNTAKRIAKGVEAIPGLYLLDQPKAMIVCFGSHEFNPLRVADVMTEKNGWSLNSLQHPNSVHLCCTVRTIGHEEKFLTDLREAVATVRANLADKPGDDSSAAIYGLAGEMPAGPVKELMFAYTDVKLTV